VGRRLPVSQATTTVITGQQDRVRARFPGAFDDHLAARARAAHLRPLPDINGTASYWISRRKHCFAGRVLNLPPTSFVLNPDNDGRNRDAG
jgi:hypothetical protein